MTDTCVEKSNTTLASFIKPKKTDVNDQFFSIESQKISNRRRFHSRRINISKDAFDMMPFEKLVM